MFLWLGAGWAFAAGCHVLAIPFLNEVQGCSIYCIRYYCFLHISYVAFSLEPVCLSPGFVVVVVDLFSISQMLLLYFLMVNKYKSYWFWWSMSDVYYTYSWCFAPIQMLNVITTLCSLSFLKFPLYIFLT